MKKMVMVFLLVQLIASLWSGTNKSVLISITDSGDGPIAGGDYGYEAWVEARTGDILTQSSTGCDLIYIAGDYNCWFVQLELANFTYNWTNGEELHLKVWEDEAPLNEQPMAVKSFTLNYEAYQLFTPDGSQDGLGIVLYMPPLAVISPVPSDGASIESGNIVSTALNWSTTVGDNSSHFDVYLSTNEDAVTNLEESALKVSDQLVGTTSYDPTLCFSKTYYWRIVSKNSTSGIETWGTVWSFTTEDEIIVEELVADVLETFEFSGGESGGDDVIPSTVGITAPAGSGRSVGSLSITKYETPPSSVPCPEYALGLLYDIDPSSYSGGWPVTVTFEWDELDFAGSNTALYVYHNATWTNVLDDADVTIVSWDDEDGGDGYSVTFTTNHFSDWMLGDGSNDSPLQPTIPEITAASQNGANFELSWSASTAAESYDIFSTADPYGGVWATEESGHSTTTWSTGIGSNEQYFYKVVANGSGALESDDSEISGYVKYDLSTTAGTDNNIIVYSMDMGFDDADDLLNSIPGCTMVSKWNTQTQNVTSYTSGDTAANFDLEDGRSYMVYVSTPGSWYCSGTLPEAASFQLNTTSTTDLNWVSMPLDMNYTNASDIIESSAYTVNETTYYKINFVTYYDTADQVWKGYALNYPSSFDFAVSPGMGIQVNLLMGPYTWPQR